MFIAKVFPENRPEHVPVGDFGEIAQAAKNLVLTVIAAEVP